MTGELKPAWTGFLFGGWFAVAVAIVADAETAYRAMYWPIMATVYLGMKGKDTMVLDTIEVLYRTRVER